VSCESEKKILATQYFDIIKSISLHWGGAKPEFFIALDLAAAMAEAVMLVIL
jgi:hypothetical protein